MLLPAPDTESIKFTSKERDAETGLDYFGARYFSSAQGRFTSPDEFTGGVGGAYEVGGSRPSQPRPLPYADITNPQSLNKYAYALNNPLRYADPDGHEVVLGNDDSTLRDQAKQRILENVSKNERALFKTVTDKSGNTKLVVDQNKASDFDGTHSDGYNLLVQTINSKNTATVVIGSADNNTTYSGSATIGNATVQLNISGDTSNIALRGLDMKTPISNPRGIIAGHELFGHALQYMTGRNHDEPTAVGVENRLRRQAGLPLRGPVYCTPNGCFY